MPDVTTYPGVYTQETTSGVTPIAGIATSVAAFIGWTAKGPIDRPEVVQSFTDFTREFGGLDARSPLGYSVSHFFANGGQQALVLRLAMSGADGKVLVPNDAAFESALLPPGNTGGVHRLGGLAPFNLLCVPGESNPSVLSDLQEFCRDRRAFLIADCAADASVASLQNGPDSSATGNDAMNAAFYFPWVLASDPLLNNQLRPFPPCGFVAGIYARTDSAHGVWKSPAGTDANVSGSSGIGLTINDQQNDTLNSKAVNCIRTLPGVGTVVWGGRTMQGADARNSDWKYVAVRRTALYLERSIDDGLQWTAFEPNGEPLWAQIRSSVGRFLQDLFARGAFQGATPQQAYFVTCGNDTTTNDDIAAGIVNIVVGFAPLKPAEFVLITIRQMAAKTTPS